MKNELQQLINETSNTSEKIKEIRKGLRQRSGYNDYNAVIKNTRDEAQKKLDSGEKVSFDELKILYGSISYTHSE